MLPEGWEIKRGDEVSSKITKGASPRWQGFNYQDEGLLFVTSENVRDGFLDVSNPKFLPLSFSEKQKGSRLSNGDILINIVGASIGRSCKFDLVGIAANINQAVCLLRPTSSDIGEYIYQYLQSEVAISTLLGKQSDSARPNLTLEDIRGLYIPLPPTHERQRIVEILSAWDRAIETVEKLIANARAQKKALMQHLLTGKKRLPGFSGGWRTVSLGEIFSFKNGLNGDKGRYGAGTKFVNVMDVFRGPVLTHATIAGAMEASVRQRSEFAVLYGDVLFNRTSETDDEIALSTVYLDTVPAVFGGFVIRARPMGEAITPEFSVHCFQSPEIRRAMIRLGQGAIRANIGQGDLSTVLISLPPLPEQRKIAEILSVKDREVRLLEALLKQTAVEKSSLMQQLLTGKRRVKGESDR